MPKELKPCPACGNTQIEVMRLTSPPFCFCNQCGMKGPRGFKKDKAIAAWNALPRRLKWTQEKPTGPGWYWWRFEKNIVPHMVYVVHESTMRPVQTDRMLILYPNSKKELDVETRGGEWAGPIQEPEDAE